MGTGMTSKKMEDATNKSLTITPLNPCLHWHLLSFTGPDGRYSCGVVDQIAVRKDHSEPFLGTKRGDALRIILMQVKGGSAAAHALLSDQASCFTRPQSTPVDYSHKLAREFARNKFEAERFAYTGEDLYDQ